MFTLIYMIAPLPWKYFRPFTGQLVSVEINSFLSFARRVAWKRGHKWAGDVFHVLFLASWIWTRLIIYPALMVVFLKIAYEEVRPPYTTQHLPLLFVPVHGYFVVMNFVWSKQLFTPIVQQVYREVKQRLVDTWSSSTNKTVSNGQKEE